MSKRDEHHEPQRARLDQRHHIAKVCPHKQVFESVIKFSFLLLFHYFYLFIVLFGQLSSLSVYLSLRHHHKLGQCLDCVFRCEAVT